MAQLGKPVDYRKKRVLLVESSGSLRTTIFQMLKSLGVENIIATGNYREIFSRLEFETYDFILIAHNESDPVSGLQILEEARFKNWTGPATGWILLTANASQDTVLHAIDNRPDAMLSKPFNVADLKKRMDLLSVKHEAFRSVNLAHEDGNLAEAAKLCLTRFSIHSRFREEAELRACQYLLDLGEYGEAKQLAERLYWRAQRKECGLLLGRALLGLKQYDPAFEVLQGLVQEHPLYLAPYDLLADVFDAKGDTASALEVMRSATQKSPLAVQRQLELGRLATNISELDVAEFAYKRSIVHGQHSCHNSPEPFLRLANVVRLKGVDDEQLGAQRSRVINDVLAAAIKRFNNNPELKVQIAVLKSEVERERGNDAEADRLSQEAAELNETLAAPVNFAELMSSLNGQRKTSSISAPKPATSVAGDSLAPKVSQDDKEQSRKANRQGVKHYAGGQRTHARKYFSLALKFDPNYYAALLNLAQVDLELARDKSESRQVHLDNLANSMDKMATLQSNEEQRRKYNILSDLWEAGVEKLPDGPVGQMLR